VLVTQNGNTANNGFFNALILSSATSEIICVKPSLAGITHAFSLPAWEISALIDFTDATSPKWSGEDARINIQYVSEGTDSGRLTKSSLFPGSENDYYAKLSEAKLLNESEIRVACFRPPQNIDCDVIEPAFRSIFRFIIGFLVFVKAHYLKKRLRVPEESMHSDIHITIGASLPNPRKAKNSLPKSVILEHGQLRWMIDSKSSPSYQRNIFKKICVESDHVWVTNVDQRTLNIAEELLPSKWSVLPHPYVLDPRAPYSELNGVRDQLLQELNSEFLVFNASSLSVEGDQKKGTLKLIDAIATLRLERKISIGLVLVNWGSDSQRVIKKIHSVGLTNFCRLVNPMSRVALQQFMSHFDVIADQFEYDAFGGLTIRGLEQGMPLLSKPIGSLAVSYIGDKPPTLEASNSAEIYEQLLNAFKKSTSLGRDAYLEQYREIGRKWITERHHHEVTRRLQVQRYSELLLPTSPPANPGAWGQMPNWSANRQW
jgi:hypothetical protein